MTTYTTALSVEETALIKSAVLYCVRKLDNINTSTLAAQVVTRLNEARMYADDVRFLNTCLSKFHEIYSDGPDRYMLQALCTGLQNKLAGVGSPRVSA